MNRHKVADQATGVMQNCDKRADVFNTVELSLKDSLKSKILRKRNEKGLEHISVDFSPKSSQPMTKAEREKDYRRKECNRKSANRSRMKAKEEKEENEKMLREEEARKNELLHKVNQVKQQRDHVLKRLREIGVSENEILHRLSAITCENKILESAHRDIEEDERSVFYLTRSEENETNSETSTSFSSEASDDILQNGVFDTTLESDETLARYDVDTGYDVMDQGFGFDSSGSLGGEYQILPANEVDLSQMADGDVLTVIISYEDPKVPSSDEPTYTHL